MEITQILKLPNIAGALFALLILAGCAASAASQPRRDTSVTASLTGQFLVASQQVKDHYFAQTVIYLIAYSKEGAMGVIVNRNLGAIPYQKLLAPLGIKTPTQNEVNVYWGGPVEIGRGLVLHSPDYKGTHTQPLDQGISVSTGLDVLQALAEGKGPKQSRFMLGYTGWGAGQLDREMARGDWLIAPADPSLIFSTEPDKIWDKARLHAGMSL